MAVVSVENIPGGVAYGAKGLVEIIQNVRTILQTRKGTVPLDREFGISFEFLDSPFPLSRAKLNTEIFMAIRKYEPRAELKQIIYEMDPMSGVINPKVIIKAVENGV